MMKSKCSMKEKKKGKKPKSVMIDIIGGKMPKSKGKSKPESKFWESVK
jgi:hypothetical protein